MELKFLGRGAAFYPVLGNTSAYDICDNNLFLIDCGESVFKKLYEKDILEGIDNIYVFITHTHSDHIGSLSTLILYCDHVLNKKVNIVIPREAKYIESIKNILSCNGVDEDRYIIIKDYELDNKFSLFKNVKYVETTHSIHLDSYSIIFENDKGILYYSGDTNELDTIKGIIHDDKNIDRIYIDTCSMKTDNHIYYKDLLEVIPKDLRCKCYCMHLDSLDFVEELRENGFDVVEM